MADLESIEQAIENIQGSFEARHEVIERELVRLNTGITGHGHIGEMMAMAANKLTWLVRLLAVISILLFLILIRM